MKADIFILSVLYFSISFLSCKDETYPDCYTYETFNLAVDTPWMCNYELAPQITYRRTLNGIIDTLVFDLQSVSKDSLKFSNGELVGTGNCNFSYEVDEFWQYTYYCEKEDIDYRAEYRARTDEGLIQAFYYVHINNLSIGTDIGYYSIGDTRTSKYEYEYSTNTGVFYNNWKVFSGLTNFKWTLGGLTGKDDLGNAVGIYNPDYGFISIYQNNDNEIWDLIPN